MVFSSLFFLLCFLPLTAGLYFLCQARYRNVLLCVASILFYISGCGGQVLLLLFTATIDYWIGWRIYQSRYKKAWLCVSVVFNLCFLAYFKYANFLVDNWLGFADMFGFSPHIHGWKAVALPLGISFYTFETMAYVIDIYLERQKPARSMLDYALYITMFPHLIAGPIYRFSEIDHEIDPERRAEATTIDQVFFGLYLFCFGLGKKVVIANPMGQLADLCFGLEHLSCLDSWAGALAYTFQIYFDFSGYSDMAIGLGLVFGFHLPQNFNQPYRAKSITDFWRRWHMTLSRWFRDYLYIPLGGNRGSRLRTYRNLLIVFFLCGLWHGASWTFVVWGLYHGTLLIIERAGLGALLDRLPRVVAQPYTFLMTVIGWVLFRAPTFPAAMAYLRAMFLPGSMAASEPLCRLTLSDREYLLVFAIASLSLVRISVKRWWQRWPQVSLASQSAVVVVVLLYAVGALATSTFNPFIYFRF